MYCMYIYTCNNTCATQSDIINKSIIRNVTSFVLQRKEIKVLINNYYISQYHITLTKFSFLIGHFGCVYHGTLLDNDGKKIHCAVKSLNSTLQLIVTGTFVVCKLTAYNEVLIYTFPCGEKKIIYCWNCGINPGNLFSLNTYWGSPSENTPRTTTSKGSGAVGLSDELSLT